MTSSKKGSNRSRQFINTRKYLEEYIKIVDKQNNLVPLKLNKPQEIVYNALRKQDKANKPKRLIILKSRQWGSTTLAMGIAAKEALTTENYKAAVVAYDADSSTQIFTKAQKMYNELPSVLKPSLKASNRKELIFDTRDGKGLNSLIRCYTAGTETVGRGETFNFLLLSELAFYSNPKELMTGVMQTVPNTPNSIVIIESTPNGINYFKELWELSVRNKEEGKDGFEPIFIAWFMHDEYQMEVPEDFVLTKHEEKIKKQYNLTDEQMAWRRWAIAVKCMGSETVFNQEYPSNPTDCFIGSGNTVFDKEKLMKELKETDNSTLRRGYFAYSKEMVDVDTVEIKNIRFVDDKEGYVFLHKEPIKERQLDKTGTSMVERPYAIGADVAGSGIDYFAAKVIDNVTKKTVMTLHKQYFDTDLYAEQLYCMGVYYNYALIGVETNFNPDVNRKLEKLYYPNLYIRENIDRLYGGMTQLMTGVNTNVRTKNLMITGLINRYRDIEHLDLHKKTLTEMLNFVATLNPSGSTNYGAIEGTFDDLVMALAIAHFVGSQQDNVDKREYEEKKDDFISRNFGVGNTRNNGNGGWITW